MSKVAVQLLSYNGSQTVADAIGSLQNQTFRDFELYILENGSADASAEVVMEALKKFTQPVTFLREEKNIGFAGGHNKLFARHSAPYVLCLNQDAVLGVDYIAKLVSFLDTHPDTGSVSGKLLRTEGIIDSVGLAIRRTREVTDIGAGQTDHGQYNGVREVFAVSGAVSLYRRAAVIEVMQNTLFDERFFAYKEDVDLGWQLRLRGWRSFVVGETSALHIRTQRNEGRLMVKQSFLQRLSYRNHLYTLFKDETGPDFARDWLWILGYEFAKLGYLLVRQPAALGGLIEVIRSRKELKNERTRIQINKKNTIRNWIV